jgi:TetR/AcrR family transcriptional regulator, cholesterol catabolism regulator
MTNQRHKAKEAPPDMRGCLLDLAKDLFARRGYIGASLRDLAEMAGVTAAAVYYHYTKKEDLLREIIFEGLEQLSHSVVGALAGAGTPEERFEALVRAHLGYNVQYPRESRIIIEESRFLNEVDFAAAREKQMAILNAYRACIRQLIASGKLGPIDPSLVAFGIISVIGGWYRWYREDGPVPKDQAFEYMVQFALAGALKRTAATEGKPDPWEQRVREGAR